MPGTMLTLEISTQELCNLAIGIQKGWKITCPSADNLHAVEICDIEFVRVGLIRAEVLFR